MQQPANILWIRRLIWSYFWLLIFEGVLRKWVLPSLSTPLFLIRVPVVILIYATAIQAHIFPFNRWVLSCCLIAFIALFAGLYTLPEAPVVALFGFQADFLHLPLVFIIPLVFDIQDVKKVGFWTLILSIPMALLMALQYEAAPSAWINAGAGEGAGQIDAGMGHIRPAGTFSYITGPASFLPLVAVFLLYCQFAKTNYPRWLLVAATASLILATAVSSSRGLAVSVGIVLVSAFVAGTVLQPTLVSQRLIMRGMQGLVLLVIAASIATHLSIFSAGIETFSARIEGSAKVEGGASGFVNRGVSGFTDPIDLISTTPLLGSGLGLGTNAGSALINSGQVKYMLAEGEWARVILESGPVLGIAYLLLRLVLLVWLTWTSVQIARQGNTLPFLLIASCAPNIVGGQFGQATELGFAVLGGGLTLAAMRWRVAVGAVTSWPPAHAGTQAAGQPV